MSLLRSSFLGEKRFKMSFFVLKVRTQLFSHLEWLEFSQLTMCHLFLFFIKKIWWIIRHLSNLTKKKKTKSGTFS